MKGKVRRELEKAYESSKTHKFAIEEWTSEEWEGIKQVASKTKDLQTGVPNQRLRDLGLKITTLPDDYKFHPTVKKIYEVRKKSVEEGKGIDWGTAEALAFGTLIEDGY